MTYNIMTEGNRIENGGVEYLIELCKVQRSLHTKILAKSERRVVKVNLT